MAKLDIVLYPDDPLTKVAAPYEAVDAGVLDLARDMLETMHSFDGVGLAGPQVGVAKRILVLCEPEGTPRCLINPEILEREGQATGEEGCLSMPHIYSKVVPRAVWIRVRAKDEYGEALEFEVQDFCARIIQHEVDHLDGIMFPDRLDVLSREAAYQDWNEVRKQLLEDSQRSLG